MKDNDKNNDMNKDEDKRIMILKDDTRLPVAMKNLEINEPNNRNKKKMKMTTTMKKDTISMTE